jgi:trk system potassium uptake protein TrkH
MPVPLADRPAERAIWWLPLGLVLAVLVALPLLRTREATGGTQMTLDRTIFTAVDAVTMSGFKLAYVNPNDFKPFGQAILFLLIAAGTMITWIFGGVAIARIAQMPFTAGQIIRGAAATWGLSIIIAANLLMRPGVGLWEAIYQAASAISNFGNPIGALPSAYAWQTQIVILPLALLGSFGIPVLLDLVGSGLSWRRLHGYSRLVLLGVAATYVAGVILIAWTYWMPGYDAARTLVVSSTESMNARSLGMPLIRLRELPRASVWVVMALMFVGGCPGGAAGGVTPVCLALLVRDTFRLTRGQRISPITGHLIAWTGIYLLSVFVLVLLLSHNVPQLPGEEALFLTLSAVGTVGRSAEPLTGVGVGLHVLSVGMLIGRFFPMLLLWRIAQASNADRSDLRTDFAR